MVLKSKRKAQKSCLRTFSASRVCQPVGIFFELKYVFLTLFSIFFIFIPILSTNAQQDISLDELNKQISEKRKTIEAINQQISTYERIVGEKRDKISSLKNQIQTLEAQISKAELIVKLKNEQIDETNLEIFGLEKQIETKKNQIGEKREKISEFIRLIHRDSQKSALEIFLSEDSLSNFYNQARFVQDIEGDIKKTLVTLKTLKERLEIEQKNLSAKKDSLVTLVRALESGQAMMQRDKVVKSSLVESTKSDEQKYQKLLQEMRAEQAQANNEIVTLEKALRERLEKEGNKRLEGLSGQKLMWPIVQNTITAYFHDPDYPFRNVFEHPAIDVRSSQGSSIRAAASGYVARAKDAGMGYSFISIIHADGISTVYGHVSCINVKEDQFVVQGQNIGCTGGLPGTKGAGRLTTGPHLHFEVRVNGIPVNPLDYLP